MQQSTVRLNPAPFLAAMLTLGMMPGTAHAQDCSTKTRAGAGFSAGRSLTPYFSLSRGVIDASETGSLLMRGGVHLAGRVDVPIAGPWRARVEVSGANWRVERQRYGDEFQLLATDTVGRIEARQVVALVGRQGGRSGACGYVLAGPGIYSLGIEGMRVRRPGVALTAGMEVPVNDRHAVQLDAQLYVIRTSGRPPIASSDALAASISVGWSHRF